MRVDMRRVTWLALGTLVAGLLIGAMLASARVSWTETAVALLEPVGALWVNAVRMTIVPLVTSMLLVAVASADTLRSLGRLGGVALLFFLGALIVVGVASALLAPALFAPLTIDPGAAEALRQTAAAGAREVATTVRRLEGNGVAQRLTELVPTNPVRAAADGAMLPLVVFTVILGAALSRLPADVRDAPIRFFRAIADAMLLVVRWVFLAAPAGVFALAIVVGARLGYSAVTAVGYYLGVFAVLIGLTLLLTYAAAVILGRVSLRRFAEAVAPAQVIALGSRSSSAALPAMLESARDVLHLPSAITSFILPAAVAIFRITAPMAFVLGALFLGKLYGVSLDAGQIVTLVVLAILLSYSVPPVPSGSLFLMAPVFVEFGIPAEGVAILIAIDVIPDLLKTTTIVTAHMASAVVVARVAATAPEWVETRPVVAAAQ